MICLCGILLIDSICFLHATSAHDAHGWSEPSRHSRAKSRVDLQPGCSNQPASPLASVVQAKPSQHQKPTEGKQHKFAVRRAAHICFCYSCSSSSFRCSALGVEAQLVTCRLSSAQTEPCAACTDLASKNKLNRSKVCHVGKSSR